MAYGETLFAKESLRAWLEQRQHQAIDDVRRVDPDEMLGRPHEQVADEVLERYIVPEPSLDTEAMTGDVSDQQLDVSRDFNRVLLERPGPLYIDGSRITFRVPYSGPTEVLRLRAGTFTYNPPRATIGDGYLSVHRDVPADTLARERDGAVKSLKEEIVKIARQLDHTRRDIATWNENLRTEVHRAAEARRKKVLADRDTEAILGVPLHRDQEVAKTYRVQPIKRKRITPARQRGSRRQPFTPEPAIDEADFADLIGDIANITRTFERLAITYAGMPEERLRDQILAMLGNAYGPATGESFSKRGKSDIFLPWDGAHPIFLAECKWWTGPGAFAERDLPQLLDRYIVWRDTHAAMILFIRNRDATRVIETAQDIIRAHDRYLRSDPPIGDVPIFILHKDGDPDREMKLALITAAIRV